MSARNREKPKTKVQFASQNGTSLVTVQKLPIQRLQSMVSLFMPIDFFLNVFTTYVSAVLIIFGSSVNIVQPLVGFPMAVLVLFVEVPFCLKCCPTGPNFDKFMLKFNSNPLRALLYFILSLIIWLVVNPGGVVMGVLPGLSLTAAFVCYTVASFRKEQRENVVGGQV